MKRCATAVFILLIAYTSYAQSSDFIQLKKGDKVLQTWFKDNVIYMQLQNGTWMNAIIYKIKDDSLYLRPFEVVYYTRGQGINAMDTVFYGAKTINVNYINAFPKDKGSGLIKKGTLFKAGGGGFLLLNVINTLSNNEPVFGADNLPKLSIAAGVLAVGVVLGLTYKPNYIIGKKYRIEYISIKP